MKSIFFLLIFSFSLFAVDASDFDIKGIKLGMSKKEVLKRMPCSNPKIETWFIDTVKGKKICSTSIVCSNDSDTFSASINRKNKLYSIARSIKFKVKPNYKKIKNKLLQRYGSTNYIKFKSHNNNMGICWGQCMLPEGAIYRTKDYNSQALIAFANRYYDTLSLELQDDKVYDENNRWESKQREQYEKQQREKASDIDF